MKEWRAANKDKVQANFQRWKEANADARKAYMQEYQVQRSACPEQQLSMWKRNLWRNYRLNPDEFNELWAAQQGKCAICRVDMKPKGRSRDAVSVDHNHDTGAVRGLLCQGCNRGIGNLMDSPEVLEAAAKYLRERGSYTTTGSI